MDWDSFDSFWSDLCKRCCVILISGWHSYSIHFHVYQHLMRFNGFYIDLHTYLIKPQKINQLNPNEASLNIYISLSDISVCYIS